MKKIFLVVMIAMLTAVLCFAQGTPSSKATASVNTVVKCTASGSVDGTAVLQDCVDIFKGTAVSTTPDNFVRVMGNRIKVSNSQSLFVSPSLVTGLYTSTKVSTKPSTTTVVSESKAVAEGGVYMRAVLKDLAGNIVAFAEPVKRCNPDILGCKADGSGSYGVVLDSRIQSLTQQLSQCIVNVTVGGVSGSGTCDFTLTTELLLQTTSAHTFNFIFPEVGVGTYDVEIQAAVNSNATTSGTAAAIGAAAFGLGSLTVESVRLIHDFEMIQM